MKPMTSIIPQGWFRPLALSLALAAAAVGCSKPSKPVVVPPLSSVVVTPAADTLQFGEIHALSAVATDLSSNVVSVPFSWSSSNPGIASVDVLGQVLGVGEGTALIVAEAGGLSDSCIVAVYPDTGWVAQTSNASENLNGVHFRPDGRNGWAVGSGGLILATTDAGVTWTRQTPSTFTLNSVWFWSDDDGCVAGNGGTILKSKRLLDGTLSWVRADSVFSGENLYDVTFANSDSLIGWAVGQNGVVLRTTNGGMRWEKQFIPGGQTLRSVSFSSTLDGWAVGDNGVIAGTHNRGVTWFVVQPGITTQGLRAVWQATRLRSLAVGTTGAAPRTWVPPADSIQWRLENAGASYQLSGVCFGDSVAFAVGSIGGSGAAERSDDFGVTWTPQFPRSQYALNDVFFVDRQRGWAVGNSGAIRHTARGGTR
jgi:photosystem II stability/assembly factor-like uncharacterized protein